VAKIAVARRALELEGATLVTVPIPIDAEIPSGFLQEVLNESLVEAEKRGIAGYELTPFLLSRMGERSNGATLRANIALLENNARVAAQIALALTREC
jgi:pseudouridine-5'-phosphate glycosidase